MVAEEVRGRAQAPGADRDVAAAWAVRGAAAWGRADNAYAQPAGI
jgi:hypothetical protein